MTISVIIPVYNVESTLRRCIASVLSQSFADWEAILVDDGSTDSSGVICDEYASKDARIHVVHKANGGLSEARNTGINVAKGDFITFMDSDDYVDNDAYEKVIEIACEYAETEILEYPAIVHKGHKTEYRLDLDTLTYNDARSYWIDGKAYEHTYAWNKFFRRYLFDDVVFPSGKYFEDAWTLPLILQKNPIIMTISQGLYYYQWNDNGITARPSGERLHQLLYAQIEASHLLRLPLTTDETAEWYLHLLNIQIDVCRFCGVQPILPDRKLPRHLSRTMPDKIKITTLNLFGIKALCRLYRIIKGKSI